MQLMLAIVQDEDANLLCERLNAQGFRLTRFNTVGSFLARGNVTILIGVEDEQFETVLQVIRATCHTRQGFINPMPWGTEPVHLALAAPATPLEVQIGGATVFAFPVKRFLRLRGDEILPPSEVQPLQSELHPEPGQSNTQGASPMNLVLTIVQNEDADPVTQALLAASYRVTRINTAGGFLRRGNVTLLIGVEEDRVDDVIRLIHENCQVRTAVSALEAGMPAYSATVFVLEASRFLHV